MILRPRGEGDYEDLETADLTVGAVYAGGPQLNVKADPLHRLLPGVGDRRELQGDGAGGASGNLDEANCLGTIPATPKENRFEIP